MRVVFLIVTVAAAILIASVGLAAEPDAKPTPVQIIAKQKRVIASLRDQRDELKDERAAQNDLITTLQSKIANTPAPLDAVLARGPDGLWAAVRAIYGVFPITRQGLCGYDKGSTQSDLLTPESLTFYSWQVC